MTQNQTINFFDPGMGLKSLSTKNLKRKYKLFRLLKWPALVNTGKELIESALNFNIPFVKKLVKNTIFDQFCGGETINECEPQIKKLYEHGVQTVLDFSAEGEEKETVFDNNTEEILNTIKKAAVFPEIPFCVFKVSGLGSNRLLEKKQRGDQITFREHETFNRMAEEQMEFYNKQKPIVYNTYQMYRKDKLQSLQEDLAKARKNNYYLGAKIVRGAYVEKEKRVAAKNGNESPVHNTKKES